MSAKWKQTDSAKRFNKLSAKQIEELIRYFADSDHTVDDIMHILNLSDEEQVLKFIEEEGLTIKYDEEYGVEEDRDDFYDGADAGVHYSDDEDS